jgi:predicted MFS family arabinose efflux permease
MGIGGTVVFALLANNYGNRAYAHVMGIKWIFTTTSGAIASYGGGYAFDHFGTYAPAFYACAVLSILGFVILLFVQPPVRKDTKPFIAVQVSG